LLLGRRLCYRKEVIVADALDDEARRRLPPARKRVKLVKNGETRKVEVQTLGPKALAALVAQRKRKQAQSEPD
jgi:hypothetical protein